MADNSRVFIGVAWPYANGPQHIGHIAGVYLPSDTFARFQRLRGKKVLMVSGSDSHGTPITISAEKEGITPNEVVDRFHTEFIDSYQKLGFTFDLFTHTDTQCHWDVSQSMFKRHNENEYLEVKTQEQLYDPVDERFLPDRYVEGDCPKCGTSGARGDQCDACGETFHSTELKNPHSILNPDHQLEVRNTDHFFFKLSKLNDAIKDYLEKDKSHWRSHVLNFSKGQVETVKLEDRAITRDIDWGVTAPVEQYQDKRLYVWYEAVMGYYSAAVEWAKLYGDEEDYKKWWSLENDKDVKSYYFLGKDNIVFHAILWPAFLIAHGDLILPYDVPANQHLNSYGQKFSKSRGIIISVKEILENYQPDYVRYALTSMAPENADADFTWEDFQDRINNELAANWGNLVQRALTFAYRKMGGVVPQKSELQDIDIELLENVKKGFEKVGQLYDSVKLKSALQEVRELSSLVNKYFNDAAPWAVLKTDEARAQTIIYVTLQAVDWLKILWSPILPFSSEKIHQMLGHEGQIGGRLETQNVDDERGAHQVLHYDHSTALGVWEPTELTQGQKLNEPEILFPKVEIKTSEE